MRQSQFWKPTGVKVRRLLQQIEQFDTIEAIDPEMRWIVERNWPHLIAKLNAGYIYLEVRCAGCDTNQTVALDIIRRQKTTPFHELERYMRCRDCSRVRGYAYKRSHLAALRRSKISASVPPSTWWPRGDFMSQQPDIVAPPPSAA